LLSAARAAERRDAGGALAIALATGLAFISAVLALAIHMGIAMFPRSPRSIRQSLTRHRDNLTRALGVLFRQPASIPPQRRRSQARTP
jgi:hypothetical protein